MSVMKKLVVGNWKMHGNLASNKALIDGIRTELPQPDERAALVVCPAFPYLFQLAELTRDSGIGVGVQNVSDHLQGAYTGETSPLMVKELGGSYAIIGHSERRQYQGENDGLMGRKALAAIDAGLIPVICVGETAEERDSGRTHEVLARQLDAAFGYIRTAHDKIILAYEPRWAIGATEAASPDYIEARHRAVRAILRRHCGEEIAERTRIIYGGSVTPENGRDILAIKDVDGLFVGRAAWKPEGFARIVELVSDAAKRKRAE